MIGFISVLASPTDWSSLLGMNYTPDELRAMGMRIGANVVVHKTVEFFNPGSIELGSNVRIDCFCVITARARVAIGNNVHLAAGVMIFGNEGVDIGNFAGLSSRVTIYTASDDYVEGHLTNPTIPERFKKVKRGPVVLGEHVIIGCGSIILPGVTLARGVSVGAISLIGNNIPEFSIVLGNPSRVLGKRDGGLLARLEAEYLKLAAGDRNGP